MKKSLLFAGLDVHAQNITLAVAPGEGAEARLYGSIPNDLHAVEKVFAKLRKAHPGAEMIPHEDPCVEARSLFAAAEVQRLRQSLATARHGEYRKPVHDGGLVAK